MASTGRAVHMIVTSTVLVSLAATAVVLRFTARQRRHLPYKKDDWLSLVGQILLFAMLVESILWVVLGGAGQHWRYTTAQEKVQFFKIFYASQVTYIVVTPIIKLAVLGFYQRIFDVRKFRIVTYVLMTIISLYFLGHFVFAVGFSCRPIRKAWDPSAPGVCAAPLPQIITFQAVNIAFDFIILALPIRMCWSLHRPWQDRVAISAVFLVGAFACAASVARLDTILKIDHQDMSYSIYDASVWTLVEPCIGQVCGCLPVARGLFPAWTPSRSYISRGGSSSASGDGTDNTWKGPRFFRSSKNPFSHHHGEKMSNDRTHYVKSDDKPLVTERIESKEIKPSFELRRTDSHASKNTTCSRGEATAELEMV